MLSLNRIKSFSDSRKALSSRRDDTVLKNNVSTNKVALTESMTHKSPTTKVSTNTSYML